MLDDKDEFENLYDRLFRQLREVEMVAGQAWLDELKEMKKRSQEEWERFEGKLRC
jgi:hypothetical protein